MYTAMGEIVKKTRSSWEDLPNECWASIFARLDHHPRRLQPLSLVCKRFLAVTRLLRTTLILPSPASVSLPLSHIYSGFSNLKSLHLCHALPSLDGFVRELARSNLPLQSLHLAHQSHFPREAMRLLGRSSVMRNTLKTLSCTYFDCLTDDDLFVVADCFSYLHRLDFDHYEIATITDHGICAISARLTSLLSMMIGVNDDVSNRTFESLSSNCPLLCGFKARFGVKCSVSLDYFASFASLSYLDLDNVIVHDSGFVKLSEANLKLEKLVLRSSHSRGSGKVETNGAGMCRFLKSCRSLRHLKLKFMEFTSDTRALDFVGSIPNVQVIELCSVDLPDTILFDLLEGCPNLEEIILTLAYVEIVDILNAPIHHRLRKLVLTGWGLCDETLMVIAPICPNLEYFYVSNVPEVTDRGMEAILASCCNIKICERTTCSYSKCWKRNGV